MKNPTHFIEVWHGLGDNAKRLTEVSCLEIQNLDEHLKDTATSETLTTIAVFKIKLKTKTQ